MSTCISIHQHYAERASLQAPANTSSSVPASLRHPAGVHTESSWVKYINDINKTQVMQMRADSIGEQFFWGVPLMWREAAHLRRSCDVTGEQDLLWWWARKNSRDEGAKITPHRAQNKPKPPRKCSTTVWSGLAFCSHPKPEKLWNEGGEDKDKQKLRFKT